MLFVRGIRLFQVTSGRIFRRPRSENARRAVEVRYMFYTGTVVSLDRGVEKDIILF